VVGTYIVDRSWRAITLFGNNFTKKRMKILVIVIIMLSVMSCKQQKYTWKVFDEPKVERVKPERVKKTKDEKRKIIWTSFLVSTLVLTLMAASIK
jgi:hypothetical protein